MINSMIWFHIAARNQVIVEKLLDSSFAFPLHLYWKAASIQPVCAVPSHKPARGLAHCECVQQLLGDIDL
jgi:hypothetical protein